MIEIGKRAGVVALAQIELAAAAIEAGAFAAEADRLLIIVERAVDIAEIAPHRGAVDVRRRRIGIELDGDIVVGDRLTVIAARVPGIAAVLVGGRKIGRERDRLVEVGKGVGDVAAIEISEPAQFIGDAFLLALQASRFEHARAGGDALLGQAFGLGGAQFRLARLRESRAGKRQSGGHRRERSRSKQSCQLGPTHEPLPLTAESPSVRKIGDRPTTKSKN